MNVSIVLGSFYGDEGKGQQVARLAQSSPSQTLVVRFNGGHQAGHTVVREDGHRHVFSSFCSGALHGAASAISRFCTVSPAAVVREYCALSDAKDSDTNLKIYVDPRCPVTTPMDMLANQVRHGRQGGHMTVGVGFGDTMERHENSPYKLVVADLSSPTLDYKLDSIQHYYTALYPGYLERVAYLETKAQFISYVREFQDIATVRTIEDDLPEYSNLIFEGAQGIQLDMDHGVFPYVTRSHTTGRNAMDLLRGAELHRQFCTVYYVTRPYITRHGDGPMPAHTNDANIRRIRNAMRDETNVRNEYQGSIRFTEFNPKLFMNSVEINRAYCPFVNEMAVVSHADLHPELSRKVAESIYLESGINVLLGDLAGANGYIGLK